MRALIWIAILPLMLALAGCGMRPLYGTSEMSAGVSNELAAIAIAEPTTRLAQLIRNDLISTMRPAGTAVLCWRGAGAARTPIVTALRADATAPPTWRNM